MLLKSIKLWSLSSKTALINWLHGKIEYWRCSTKATRISKALSAKCKSWRVGTSLGFLGSCLRIFVNRFLKSSSKHTHTKLKCLRKCFQKKSLWKTPFKSYFQNCVFHRSRIYSPPVCLNKGIDFYIVFFNKRIAFSTLLFNRDFILFLRKLQIDFLTYTFRQGIYFDGYVSHRH